MATVNVTLNVRYNEDLGTTTLSLAPSQPEIHRGDSVVITIQPLLSASSYVTGVNLSNWDSTVWTNTSAVDIIGFGNSTTKTVKSDAPYTTDSITVLVYKSNGNYTGTVSLNITDTVDSTPSPFSLGPDIYGLQPNESVVLDLVTVSGINTGVAASITNGSFTVNNGFSTASATVYVGDKLLVTGNAPSGYTSSQVTTLTVGGVSDSVGLYTANSPSSGSFIAAPFTSVPFNFSAVKAFFGGSVAAPTNMRAYLRGAGYVPDIVQNNNIPTSGTLQMTNFLNSGTSLYFTVSPRSQSASLSTISAGGTLTLTWSLGTGTTNFDIGYGVGMRGAVDFQYLLAEDSGGGKATGVSLVSASGSPGVYNSSNNYVSVTVTVPAQTEARYSGTITINIRSKFNNAVVVTQTMRYFLNFFGP